MSDNFEIITSIRSDQILRDSKTNASYDTTTHNGECQFYLLSLHRDRLIEACEAFGRSCEDLRGNAGLISFKRQLQGQINTLGGRDDYGEPLKLRVTFTKHEDYAVTASYVPTVPIEALFPENLDHIVTSTDATYYLSISQECVVPSLFTQHKTTNRGHYDEQRARQAPASSAEERADILHEILLANDSGAIMEGTITTPYFYRDGVWITPSIACGGHLGVARRWALATGICKEGLVLAEDVAAGEQVILSNGVRGFGWGEVGKL